MANKCIRRYSTSLIIRERQNQATVRCLFTPVRVAIIKKTRDKRVPRRMCRKGDPGALLGGVLVGTASMENSTVVSQTIKN